MSTSNILPPIENSPHVNPVMLPPGRLRLVTKPLLNMYGWNCRAAHVIAHHVALYNAVFATIQLVIAAGFFARRTVRPALAASMVWAVFVWWFGEGLGGILTGGSPLVGAPGAVLLYALIALLRWPAPEHDRIINGSKSRDDHGCKPLAMRFASMIDVMDVPLGPLLGTHRYIHAAEHHSPTAPIRDACTQIMKIGDP